MQQVLIGEHTGERLHGGFINQGGGILIGAVDAPKTS